MPGVERLNRQGCALRSVTRQAGCRKAPRVMAVDAGWEISSVMKE